MYTIGYATYLLTMLKVNVKCWKLALNKEVEKNFTEILLYNILKNGPIAQAKWVDETSKMGREPQKQFLKYFNHLLEQSIRLKVLGKDLQLDPDLKDFALRINKIAGIGQLEAMIQELDKAVYYIERNANPKMLFMELGIKFYHIIQNKTLILTEA